MTEEGKNSQVFYGFRGQWLRQGFQTWPTTSPSDTLVPGPDVPFPARGTMKQLLSALGCGQWEVLVLLGG